MHALAATINNIVNAISGATAAALDRLTHRCHIIEMKGENSLEPHPSSHTACLGRFAPQECGSNTCASTYDALYKSDH